MMSVKRFTAKKTTEMNSKKWKIRIAVSSLSVYNEVI